MYVPLVLVHEAHLLILLVEQRLNSGCKHIESKKLYSATGIFEYIR